MLGTLLSGAHLKTMQCLAVDAAIAVCSTFALSVEYFQDSTVTIR